MRCGIALSPATTPLYLFQRVSGTGDARTATLAVLLRLRLQFDLLASERLEKYFCGLAILSSRA